MEMDGLHQRETRRDSACRFSSRAFGEHSNGYNSLLAISVHSVIFIKSCSTFVTTCKPSARTVKGDHITRISDTGQPSFHFRSRGCLNITHRVQTDFKRNFSAEGFYCGRHVGPGACVKHLDTGYLRDRGRQGRCVTAAVPVQNTAVKIGQLAFIGKDKLFIQRG